MTRGLKEMATWLASLEVEAIAMKATAVYWKPVWNILEAEKKFQLLLVNAHHVKHVPGRKTDQKDSEWIAEWLQHGVLKGSFVAPPILRRLRDLTRTCAKVAQNVATFANRIQKVLEDANVKLGSVATDTLGVWGRRILKGLINGQRDPKKLAQLARGGLRKKLSELQLALEGHFTEHHGFQIKARLELVEFGEKRLRQWEEEIRARTPAAGAGTSSTGWFRNRGGGHLLHASNQSLAEGGGAVGYDPRRRPGNRLDVGSANGSQHGSVRQHQPVGERGGDMSRQS
jgi:transposase